MPGDGTGWASKLVRDEFAKKLLWLLVAAVATGAAAVAAWAASFITVVDVILIGIICVLVFAAIVHALMARMWYKLPWYPSVGHHFEILDKTIGYVVREDGVLHFYRRMKVKALADNLNSYIDKFVWTGGAKSLPTAGDGAVRIEEDITASLWTYYRTVLTHSLRKGQEHEFQVDWFLPDWRSSRPFFSTSTEEPTKRLSFEMEVPEACLAPGGVYFEVMRGIESSYPFAVTVLHPVRGRLIHTIKPKLYRHYRLRWEWAGAELQPLPTAKDELSDS